MKEGVWLFYLFLIWVVMLVALAISHLLMPAALTLQDYHYLCLWLVRNINKNPINMSFSLVETGVPREKPLQARQRADWPQENFSEMINQLFVLGLFTAVSWKERPGPCIIKLITAVIYGFRIKLECLSLASLSSLVLCLRTNTLAYYGRNKFYDSGPGSTFCRR